MYRKKIADSVLDLIGNTPMVRLNKVTSGVEATVLAKCEFLNPSGSHKDRIALQMVQDAEREGKINNKSNLVEASSGNMGTALSMIGAIKGYKVTVFMTENTSAEAKRYVKHFGANIVETPAKRLVVGAVREAERYMKEAYDREMLEERNRRTSEFVKSTPDAFMPGQFTNLANIRAHYETTGVEILEQTDGKLDAVVMGVGSGGTILGVARRIRERNKNVKFYAVEPEESSPMTGGKIGPHGIQGIGDGFIPPFMETGMKEVDGVITVSTPDAMNMAKRLAREEGLFVGISAGANVVASLKVAKDLGRGRVVVTFLPDSASRYFSTDLFA
jgi:cysteine synthase A